MGGKNYHKITIRNLVLALTEKLESNLHDITINNYLLLSYIKQADFIKCTESHFKTSIRVIMLSNTISISLKKNIAFLPLLKFSDNFYYHTDLTCR